MILVSQAKPVGLAQAVIGETLGRFDLDRKWNLTDPFQPNSTQPSAKLTDRVLL